MEKTIIVHICDCCQNEADNFYDFIIPWPETMVAYGGKNQIPTIQYSKKIGYKNIELCDQCAINFARFLTQATRPEGVIIEWEE